MNSFLAKQCPLIKNNGKIPTDSHLLTDQSLSNDTLTGDDIVQIMSGLNRNKAYGHKMINIHQIKLRGNSISNLI